MDRLSNYLSEMISTGRNRRKNRGLYPGMSIEEFRDFLKKSDAEEIPITQDHLKDIRYTAWMETYPITMTPVDVVKFYLLRGDTTAFGVTFSREGNKLILKHIHLYDCQNMGFALSRNKSSKNLSVEDFLKDIQYEFGR